jgi:Ca2+-binding RTX toxin-like protein
MDPRAVEAATIGEIVDVSPAVDLLLSEMANAGLYVDPGDTTSLIGEKVSVDKEVESGKFSGQIGVTAQVQTVTAAIVAEDVAGNRMTGSEKVVIATDSADQIGESTATTEQLLFGFGGDDDMFGGLGKDSFLGGTGSDRFVISEGSGNTDTIIDVVMDFSTLADTLVTGYAGDANSGDYEEADGSGFADLAAMISDAEGTYFDDGTRYVLYYDASVSQNSTEKVSAYLLIDWDETPDGIVDQVVELVGIASAEAFDGSDIVA